MSDEVMSRSVLRRKAIQKGESFPTFSQADQSTERARELAQDNQPCCAHLTVLFVRIDNGNGTCSASWECRDCKHPFWPGMGIVERTPADAQAALDKLVADKVREAVTEASAQSKKETYCAYCGHTEPIDVDGSVIAEHIRTCEKHPAREWVQEAVEKERDHWSGVMVDKAREAYTANEPRYGKEFEALAAAIRGRK